jgi:hypothetical protein
MPRARWTIPTLRLCALAAALLLPTACGGSPGPSLSGRRIVPQGYAVFHATGFSFAYPAGWRVSPYQSDQDHGGVSIVPPGPTPVDAAYPRIDTELSAARASRPTSLDFRGFIDNIEGETAFKLPDGQPLANRVDVGAVAVPGASAARLATVFGRAGRREQDLVVLGPRGVVELSVAWFPANQQLDPRAVIDSLRLSR